MAVGFGVNTTAEVVRRVMTLDDVEAVVDLHRELLPAGFFAALGGPFLRSYYRSYLLNPAGVGLVAEVDGEVAGFALGTVDEEVHYRHVLRWHGWRMALWGLLGLSARPHLIFGFCRTRAGRYLRSVQRRLRKGPSGPGPQTRSGTLSHMAVAPSAQRRGLGRMLVTAFVDAARAQGSRRLRVLAAANRREAQSLYASLGWERGSEVQDADGRCWTEYWYRLE